MNPLLLDIPQELGSERLALRGALCAGDGEAVFASVRESLGELKIWMPWAKDDYGQADAEQWCRKCAADYLTRTQLQFLMLAREGGEHLGSIGAVQFGWEARTCEIGYWLRTSCIGKGYMTEAVATLVLMLRQGLRMRRIQICADARNQRSRKLAERCGAQLEGILRKVGLANDGSVRNTCVYALIDEGD